MKHGKKYNDSVKLLERAKLYDVNEALGLAIDSHHIRSRDNYVKFHPAFALNLFNVFIRTRIISACFQCWRNVIVAQLERFLLV